MTATYWSLSIEDVGCRGRRLFSIDGPGALTEHDQWIPMGFRMFSGFRQRDGKATGLKSTQIQFI